MMNEFNDIDKNPLTKRYLQKAQVRIIPEVWPWRMSWVFTGGCTVKSLWESRHSMCRPVYRACAARWPGEGTGCDTIGALAEIWRTGFLPFNPYNPLPISVCHYHVILITHIHIVPQERLLLCYWANGSYQIWALPDVFLLPPPIFSASKRTCTAHRILHLPFPWSVALFCLYLTVPHPSALELNFICTGNISMIIHQPCLWCWVTCHS